MPNLLPDKVQLLVRNGLAPRELALDGCSCFSSFAPSKNSAFPVLPSSLDYHLRFSTKACKQCRTSAVK